MFIVTFIIIWLAFVYIIKSKIAISFCFLLADFPYEINSIGLFLHVIENRVISVSLRVFDCIARG